jgi:hypothetical protein
MSGAQSSALDRLEAELLREARQELAPDPARVDSLWRSVAAASTLGAASSGVSWAAPRPVTTPPSAPPLPAAPAPTTVAPALATGSASFGLRALTIAAMGGALLGFAAGYGAGGAQKAHEPLSAVMMASNKAASNTSQESAAADAATPQRVDEPQAPTVTPGSSAKPRAPGSSKAGSSTAGSNNPTAESAKPSFYEELSYLKRAQSALRQGNGALALGLMTELDSIQPGGALLSERGVTKVLAHCQLGDVASAERVTRRLAANGLASVYTERLEKSCAGAVLSK